MMTTTCRILWIPVAGAILTFSGAELDSRFRVSVGSRTRHCCRPLLMNLNEVAKLESARRRGCDSVRQPPRARRCRRTYWPPWLGTRSGVRFVGRHLPGFGRAGDVAVVAALVDPPGAIPPPPAASAAAAPPQATAAAPRSTSTRLRKRDLPAQEVPVLAC